MLYGLSGAKVPVEFPFAEIFNVQGFPLVVASIGWRETLSVMSPQAAMSCISSDGGHGIMQLTSSYPDPGWDDPRTNIGYAWSTFIVPAINYWHGLENQTGDNLLRLVAATYNAGLSAAIAGHAAGNVDLYTTNNYALGVSKIFDTLAAGEMP